MTGTTTGIVLLSKDNFYLDAQGKLPARPSWDKTFLLAVCKDKKLLCSKNTLADLPPSIKKNAVSIIEADSKTAVSDNAWEVNLGIASFKLNIPHVFFVVRSDKECGSGKPFYPDYFINNFILSHIIDSFADGSIEVYKRRW